MERRGDSREGVVGEAGSLRGDPRIDGFEGSKLFWKAAWKIDDKLKVNFDELSS